MIGPNTIVALFAYFVLQLYVAVIITLHYDQIPKILQTSRKSPHFQENQNLKKFEL